MKISYRKRFHPTNGTVYTQAISMNEMELNHLIAAVDTEIMQDYPRHTEYSCENHFYLYMVSLRNSLIGNIYYLNLTQKDFINLFLKYAKLELKDQNTVILIK